MKTTELIFDAGAWHSVVLIPKREISFRQRLADTLRPHLDAILWGQALVTVLVLTLFNI